MSAPCLCLCSAHGQAQFCYLRVLSVAVVRKMWTPGGSGPRRGGGGRSHRRHPPLSVQWADWQTVAGSLWNCTREGWSKLAATTHTHKIYRRTYCTYFQVNERILQKSFHTMCSTSLLQTANFKNCKFFEDCKFKFCDTFRHTIILHVLQNSLMSPMVTFISS